MVIILLGDQHYTVFQCSSASRKFLNNPPRSAVPSLHNVSVLFSEPKIPQSSRVRLRIYNKTAFQCSSASRKFLNRAAHPPQPSMVEVSVLFSEPKIPQFFRLPHIETRRTCFSALQRAENSSMIGKGGKSTQRKTFQCSSASRKFLNS